MDKKPVVVFTAGVFDPLHYGHIRYLEAAKRLGDILIVGVLTDDGAAAYKDRPIMGWEARMEVVRALRCVDYVVKQPDTDPTSILEELEKHNLCPDIMVRGDDYPDIPPGTAFMLARKGRLVRLPYTKEISSTIYKEEAGRRYEGGR